MDSFFAWLLLPLGAVLGWAYARRRIADGDLPPQPSRAATLAGLASLASNDDDQAIAALSRAVEAEPAAVELQLALGGLFRKHGEIDRAIRLHEAALASGVLAADAADPVRLELAQDYLKAGLMDRAEGLLTALAGGGPHTAAALDLLLDLYQQSRDWKHAIETAQRVQSSRGRSMSARIAHYYCELAEAARAAGRADEARQAAEQALDEDTACVRANLLLAAFAEADKDWDRAIKTYWRAAQQDARFISELAAPLQRCYAEAGKPAVYEEFLDEAEAAYPDASAPMLAKARWLQAHGESPREYLSGRLSRKPTLQGVLLWLEGGRLPDTTEDALQAFRESLKRSLQARPRYHCGACGLRPNVLYWQCPHCKNWGTVAPAEDLL